MVIFYSITQVSYIPRDDSTVDIGGCRPQLRPKAPESNYHGFCSSRPGNKISIVSCSLSDGATRPAAFQLVLFS